MLRRQSHLSSLSEQAQRYIATSIAPSTQRQYNRNFHQYRRFCNKYRLLLFPLQQESLILFATRLSRTTSHKNISCKLSAIKFHSHLHGFDADFSSFHRLYRLIRGIKRCQANSFSKPKRLPITPPMLHVLFSNLMTSPMFYADKLMIWAAMLTAFFGFLRISEYTSSHAKSFDPASTLCRTDITFQPSGIDIFLRASKTDPFKTGTTIRLMQNFSSLCPVTALHKYFCATPATQGPLFSFQDGRYLTRRNFMTILNRLKPAQISNMSTHSFRIGAATTAAAAGHPRWLIQAMGRWTSDCYKVYLRIPDQTRFSVSADMASTKVVGGTYDPDHYPTI